jgi:hypothetical protein
MHVHFYHSYHSVSGTFYTLLLQTGKKSDQLIYEIMLTYCEPNHLAMYVSGFA